MSRALFLVFAVLLFQPLQAATIDYNGTTYYVVDWNTTDQSSDTATGTAGPIDVTFSPYSLSSANIFSGDYATDIDYDAVTYQGGSTLENLKILGHGSDSVVDQLFLSGTVSSILMFVGVPGTTNTGDEFGTSQWDFDDSLTMHVVDAEVIGGVTALRVDAGNILLNPVTPIAGNHSSGIIAIDGNFSSLAWTHIGSGTDSLNITFAIAPAAVPVPAAAWLFVSGFVLLASAGRRRSRRA